MIGSDLQNQQPTAPYHGVKSSSNGNTYSYDANGNMVTRIIGTTTYTLVFDVANRLVEVKTNGVTSAQFVYDGDGNRVKTIIGATTTTFIGSYYEKSGSTIKKYYYYGSTRVAMRNGSSLYFLLSDHLGSTTMFLNSSGSRVTELMYKPWGENRFTYGLAPSTFQYTGQRNDSGVAGGLYYYGARYFDSSLGRFISADTVVPGAGNPQAYDRYAYVFNNPLRYTDPSGHCPDDNGDGKCDTPSNWLPNGGQSTYTDDPEIDLNEYGENVYEIYQIFLSSYGDWSAYLAIGWDPLTIFLSLILNRESQPLWVYGWKGGTPEGMAKGKFSDAANHWLWGWTSDWYGFDFGSLSSTAKMNVVFNWLGRMESFEGIMNVCNGSDDPAYADLNVYERFTKVVGQFHSEQLYIADYALTNPTTGYWTWGNGPRPPDASFYQDNFYIIERYK